MQGAQDIASELETFFSRGGAYYEDECKLKLVRLVDLGNAISIHWDKSPADYQQIISKIYLLEKVASVSNLVRDFCNTCPPGSNVKRWAIRRELEHLIDDLSMK
jgi:hypothetical protein